MKTDGRMVAREESVGRGEFVFKCRGSYVTETEFQYQHVKGLREGPICTLCSTMSCLVPLTRQLKIVEMEDIMRCVFCQQLN